MLCRNFCFPMFCYCVHLLQRSATERLMYIFQHFSLQMRLISRLLLSFCHNLLPFILLTIAVIIINSNCCKIKMSSLIVNNEQWAFILPVDYGRRHIQNDKIANHINFSNAMRCQSNRIQYSVYVSHVSGHFARMQFNKNIWKFQCWMVLFMNVHHFDKIHMMMMISYENEIHIHMPHTDI